MTKPRKIQTLASFLEVIEEICNDWDCLATTTHPWFRGQAKASWSLIPGLYRGWIHSFYERELVRDFRLRSKSYLDQQPLNDLEWLFVMQHYGMPTRLLDWTESHLFALYFAVSHRAASGDAAVWILDPWSVNYHAINLESVPTADHPV
ncbi:MAG: FRG domain-containing protein, partial [Blastocatellia bacterium]